MRKRCFNIILRFGSYSNIFCQNLRFVFLYSEPNIRYNRGMHIEKGAVHSMKEKELKICIWIHHITTFIGVFLSLRALISSHLGTGRKCIMSIFLLSQMWAVIKIINNSLSRSASSEGTCVTVCPDGNGSSLGECLNHIYEQSKNEYQARGIVASLIGSSVLFKVGFPLVNQ